MENLPKLKLKLPSLIRGYGSENIHKTEIIGLIFRTLSYKHLALKREKCSPAKMSKNRLTVLYSICDSVDPRGFMSQCEFITYGLEI